MGPGCYPCTHRAGQDQGHAGQRAVCGDRAGAQHLVLESHLPAVLQGELGFSDFVKELEGGQKTGADPRW